MKSTNIAPQRRFPRLSSCAAAIFIFSLLLISIATTASANVSLAPSRTKAAIPASFFGMHFHFVGSTTTWPSNPSFGTWRLWDSNTQWKNLEQNPGVWDFSRLDSYISMAEATNVEVMLPLGLSPRWASARPDEPSAYYLGNAAEPANIENWKNYVRKVVTRYKGRIKYYEMWNEPNLKTSFSGTVDKMIELVKEASLIIREVDPEAKIVSPAATRMYGVPWLREFLRKGGGDYVDVIAYHFYATPDTPETMRPMISKVRSVSNKYGQGSKPIWNTETGWTFPSTLTLTEPEMAAYVSRSLLVSWASGVDRFYWYSYDAGQNGLIDKSGNDLPAATAYKATFDWLNGARMVSFRKNSKGTFFIEINRENGYRGWIVWKTAGTGNLKIPASWKARRARTLDGTSGSLADVTSYPVGTAPILIENTN